jgi:hypothetical protein
VRGKVKATQVPSDGLRMTPESTSERSNDARRVVTRLPECGTCRQERFIRDRREPSDVHVVAGPNTEIVEPLTLVASQRIQVHRVVHVQLSFLAAGEPHLAHGAHLTYP